MESPLKLEYDKENEKESPLKPEYDDVMLEGAFEGAYLTLRYGAIKRVDGMSYRNYDIGYNAKKMAEKKGIDGVVSYGIATAILDSLILYGKVGEKFLKEKLEQVGETFSQEEYSRDIAIAITKLYQYDRKQKIIDGVVDALRNDPNNLEANAAKSAIMQDEYDLEDRFDEGEMLEDRFLNGQYVSSEKLLKRLVAMHYKPLSEEQQLKNLNIAYEYLSKDYSRVSNDFKKEFSDISETRMICYRIANLDDEEMERLLKLEKEEKTKEER